MEEAEEKMAALKRAYADIMLNLAKESAARVMASESKALRLRQELVLTKEEAVSTLLRVKGIMDSKISEAESCQMQRIQELEIQLAEAKSTIEHLNEKLKVTSDELADVRRNHTELLDEQCTSKSHLRVHRSIGQKSLAQGTADGQCCLLFNNISWEGRSEEISAEDNFVSDTDLASIIMKSKEPELYRNGCTQRIRAFEQNILIGYAASGQTNDQISKNKCFVYEKETTEGPFGDDSLETDNMLTRSNHADGSKDVVQHGGNCESGQGNLFQSKRNRKKHVSADMGNASNLVMDHDSEGQLVNISGGAEVTGNGETMSKSSNAVSQKDMDTYCAPESNGCCRDSEDGGSHIELSIEDRPGPSKSQNTVHVDSVNSCHLNSDRRVYQSALSNVENIEHENIVGTPQLCSKIGMCSGALSEGSIKIGGDSKLTPKEENPIGTPSLGASGRLLKFTFTRKRKRGSSTSCNENGLPERKDTPKRRFGDKESALLETQKPALLTGSPRDSRRLAQVAWQLVSLSEKRW